jgi:DNA-binding CsgD family transcriptional regulator
MHACASSLQSGSVPEAELSRLHGAVRNLVSLLDSSELSSVQNYAFSEAPEQIVVDTEVDGVRYLVIRMPRVEYTRVQLSPREQEIVRMVARGHPNKVIADVLSISAWTVCTHLRRIFAKLGVSSRAAMVAQLVDLDFIRNDHQPTHLR